MKQVPRRSRHRVQLQEFFLIEQMSVLPAEHREKRLLLGASASEALLRSCRLRELFGDLLLSEISAPRGTHLLNASVVLRIHQK